METCQRWSAVILGLVYLVSCHDTTTPLAPIVYEPSWTYKCVPDEGCHRSAHPEPTSSNTSGLVYTSLDLCRTVCGRFGGLWPRPVTAALSMQTVRIHPNFLRFDLSNAPVETREILVEMTHVATQNLIDECDGNVSVVVDTPVVVYITVKTTNLDLTLNTNEQYRLDVQSKESNAVIHIVAETVYGARHGLETFTQLVSSDKIDDGQYRCGLRLVAGAKIWDQPVYGYRGFLLDTSRNFIPMDDIKRMIDAMATVKMNVFHWHVTDSHSFPLESKRVPQFTRYGAYSAYEIYSAEEVRELVHYARVRGVRVIIEIDSPAHAGNGWQWGKEYGYGDLAVCVNARQWRGLCIQPPCGQLNPANPDVYRVLRDLYKDVAEYLPKPALFHMGGDESGGFCIQPPCGQLNPANPDVYRVLRDLYKDVAEYLPKPALFHMGGDEVFLGCWNSSEEIVSYMESKDYDTTVDGFIQLWSEFHDKALHIWDEELAALGHEEKQPVMLWSSELTQTHRIQKHLSKDRYIIEVWEPINSPLLIQLLRIGYKVVSVPKDIWYLDHGFWGKTKYSNWRRMYAHTLPRDPNMLGGEVAAWSEYVDAQGLDTRVWPRTAAVAERLWADPTSGAIAAESRLQRLRSRLGSRGIRADVLSPQWCAQHDHHCV